MAQHLLIAGIAQIFHACQQTSLAARVGGPLATRRRRSTCATMTSAKSIWAMPAQDAYTMATSHYAPRYIRQTAARNDLSSPPGHLHPCHGGHDIGGRAEEAQGLLRARSALLLRSRPSSSAHRSHHGSSAGNPCPNRRDRIFAGISPSATHPGMRITHASAHCGSMTRSRSLPCSMPVARPCIAAGSSTRPMSRCLYLTLL
jgi:hypothetical protein